jgi:phosphoribosyl-ATP pyrophosphohydrolase/phosphoribosyl-AMP cyclohydrolase
MNKRDIAKLIDELNFVKCGGLVPAIAQDYRSRNVLMLGFMNKDALYRTLKTGKMNYWSRTKGRLWLKGETSGNFQHVKNVFVDCDKDSLLFQVDQVRNCCHTGRFSCFNLVAGELNSFSLDTQGLEILPEVYNVILDRITKPKRGSYVSSLAYEGEDAVLRKISEEATEAILAVKSGSKAQIIHEAADLIFHTLIVLALNKIELKEVMDELKERRRKKTRKRK